MNAEQLWSTTMDPETRTLLQVQYAPASENTDLDPEPMPVGAAEDAVFELLMGNDVPPRRAFIEERATYAQIDV